MAAENAKREIVETDHGQTRDILVPHYTFARIFKPMHFLLEFGNLKQLQKCTQFE
jgi:hypothetical protein